MTITGIVLLNTALAALVLYHFLNKKGGRK